MNNLKTAALFYQHPSTILASGSSETSNIIRISVRHVAPEYNFRGNKLRDYHNTLTIVSPNLEIKIEYIYMEQKENRKKFNRKKQNPTCWASSVDKHAPHRQHARLSAQAALLCSSDPKNTHMTQ